MNTVEPADSSHAVFLSYAAADFVTADAVCRGLEGAGLRCWIAPRGQLRYPAVLAQLQLPD